MGCGGPQRTGLGATVAGVWSGSNVMGLLIIEAVGEFIPEFIENRCPQRQHPSAAGVCYD
jgi:hypothetical protein